MKYKIWKNEYTNHEDLPQFNDRVEISIVDSIAQAIAICGDLESLDDGFYESLEEYPLYSVEPVF